MKSKHYLSKSELRHRLYLGYTHSYSRYRVLYDNYKREYVGYFTDAELYDAFKDGSATYRDLLRLRNIATGINR